MPRNGSGTFTRNYSWVTDAANGLKISSSRMDADTNDIGTELTNSIAADGQTTPTANLPMGTYHHTNVGVATARTDYARASQVQDSTFTTGTSVSGTNTIAASLPVSFAAYVAGLRFSIIPANTVTGAATVNLNGIGALTIKKAIGGGLVANVVNDIVAGVPAYFILSDTSTAVLLNPQTYSHGADVASAATINLNTATGDCVDVTGTTTITAVTLSEGVQRTVRFTGALTLTNGASLVIPGGTRTTTAGDYAIFRGYAAGVVRCLAYMDAGGQPTNRTLTRTASTSGTSITFTGINANARRITVCLEGVSTSGTDPLMIQLGAGSIQNTGYNGTLLGDVTGAIGQTAWSSGAQITSALNASVTMVGGADLTLSDSANGVWLIKGMTTDSGSNNRTGFCAGTKSLSGTLDRVRVTTTGGTDTFDAGAISVLVE